MLEQAALLSKQGYGVLLFDLHNHGESQGEITTLGYTESEDVRALTGLPPVPLAPLVAWFGEMEADPQGFPFQLENFFDQYLSQP